MDSRTQRKSSRGQAARRARKGHFWPIALTVLLLALLLAAGASFGLSRGWLRFLQPGHSLRPGQAAGYNVLLVTLDTVRRDHLGCYGCDLDDTPTIDRLAAEGIRFDDAITSVPLTLPSHATILTGLYPPNHGARNNGLGVLASSHVTLAETLRERQYDTAAFIGCFVLDARFGLDQGFQTYNFEVSREGYRPNMPDFNERPADEVTDAAIGWLKEHQASGAAHPFFLWVHYFDAHLPYRSELQGSTRFAGRPYDAEIAFVDSQLRRLLDVLEAERQSKRTVTVIVADHGEALGEHAEQTHGMLLYDGTLRIPFILSCPGLIHRGLVDRRSVGLVDVRPTLEDLLGIPVTMPCDGHSLLRRDLPDDRPIYIETVEPLDMAGWSPLYGLRSGRSKFIAGPIPRFFDLIKDPRETTNLYKSGHGEPARFEAALRQLQQGWKAAESGGRVLSDEEIERLRSLGYVSAGSGSGPGEQIDPESRMAVFNRSSEAEQLYADGRLPEAERAAEEVLSQWPTSPLALRVLAFCQLKTGRAGEAVELLRPSVSQSRDAYLIRSLAQILILSGDYAQAEQALRIYEAIDPRDGRIALLRGDILARQNRGPDALASYRRAIEIDSNRVGITARERIEALNKGSRN